ncbi:hypothetical protein E2P81_ATG01502 [Venturia nashicola]|uniref:Uncharacterized protein n=1 Tax=Venturia nashicola TaxID=86259 RepID=A0A4Z1PLZ6_9PEZI|nr:hypothetical protein E6O75_ATG01539 [Venturia nashicola]TLD38959.1 hypothetical protein E2P81_ATG01502 [Venturia nashicola]
MKNLTRIFPNGIDPEYCLSQIKNNLSVLYQDKIPKPAIRCGSENPTSQMLNYKASLVREIDPESLRDHHTDMIRVLEAETSGCYSVVVFETEAWGSIEEAMQNLLVVTMEMVNAKFEMGIQPGQPTESEGTE